MRLRHLWTYLALACALYGAQAMFDVVGTAAGAVNPRAFADARPEISRSEHGSLLSAAEMAPGHEVTGSMRIANSGNAPGLFTLSGGPGQLPSRLARRLRLVVYERVDNELLNVVYSGALDRLGSTPLGLLEPGEGRRMFFHVTLPRTAWALENDLVQGTAFSATFVWSVAPAR